MGRVMLICLSALVAAIIARAALDTAVALPAIRADAEERRGW